MLIEFISHGPPGQISGGYIYNQYILDFLRTTGKQVRFRDIQNDSGVEGSADIVVVDSIALKHVLRALGPVADRTVLLMHFVPEWLALALKKSSRDVLEIRQIFETTHIVVTGRRTSVNLRELFSNGDLKISLINPGVPSAWISRGRQRRSARKLLSLANYVANKGHLELLDSLDEIRRLPWQMSMYGNQDLDPHYFNAVQEKTESLGLQRKVNLLSAVEHAEVRGLLDRSDLLIQFSRSESYSMVTAEAIACDVPVLSTLTGDYETFAESGLVQYISSRSASKLVSTLRDLILDDELYRQLCRGPDWRPNTWSDAGRDFLRCLESI